MSYFKRLLIPLFVVVSQALPLKAQQQIRLTDNWQFLRSNLGSVWEAVRPAPAGSSEAVPIWQNITLPHCINASDAVDPDISYYQGPAWYRTRLEINNPYENGRTLLHFEGAGQKTEVYLYTTKLATHTGGYDEWTVDITDAVKAFLKNEKLRKQYNDKLPLIIKTDNSRDAEMIPSNLSDFNVYGGLYRYVNLQYLPPCSIDQLKITSNLSADGKKAIMQVSSSLYNPHHTPVNAVLELKDPHNKTVLHKNLTLNQQADSILPSVFTLDKPERWNIENPALYTANITIHQPAGPYHHAVKIGFRSFEFKENGPFFLNGKRVLLKGTHRHDDHAGVAAAMTEEMMRQEMLLIKSMGANFIRLGHYQQSQTILNLCDSLGILVWEEIPWCRGGLGGAVYQNQAKRMLSNMIQQHYHHPSIIIWGLGNENDWPGDFPEFDKEKIRSFMKELNSLSHQLDSSRKTAIRRCDFCKDIVDVYAPSIWAGWYRGLYTEYKKASEEEFKKVKHFFHAEWGGDSHAGRHAESPVESITQIMAGKGTDERSGDASLYGGIARMSKDGDWSETYICDLFDWHLKEQESMPWLTGSAQWVFKDFSTPVRPENPIPYVNQKGVVERDLTPKESFYVFQSYWASKPMAHIYGHSWPVRWGKEAEPKMVKVYSNCSQAELFLNGKSLGVKKRNADSFPAAGLHWMPAFKTGINQLRVVARQHNTIVEDTVSFVYQTRQWQQPAVLMLEKTDSSNNIITVQVTARDANGTLCLDAANQVRFSVAGDGRLIANQGTSKGSAVIQLANGRAAIRIEKNGNAAVAVQSSGLPAAILPL